jgi:hemoglobin/transferrin/lactoferrin receptor protein
LADRVTSPRIASSTVSRPPGGTPSYTLWNLRCGFRLDERATLEVACENVTDVDYRVHGSGSNGLGRNFIIGMSVTF